MIFPLPKTGFFLCSLGFWHWFCRTGGPRIHRDPPASGLSIIYIYLCIWNPSGHSFEHTFSLEWESNAVLVKAKWNPRLCMIPLVSQNSWVKESRVPWKKSWELSSMLTLPCSTISLLHTAAGPSGIGILTLEIYSLHFHQNYGFTGCTLHRWVTSHSMV